jgi:ATP-dependent DNA helicase RecG
MCKLCKDYGVKTEYTVHPGDVMLAFFAKAEAPMENVTEKTTEKTAEKILCFLRENPSLTNKELAEKCGITEDGVYYQTKKMKSKGILRRIGGDKGGRWEIL